MKKFSIESLSFSRKTAIAAVAIIFLGIIGYGIVDIFLNQSFYLGWVILIVGFFYGAIAALLFLNNKDDSNSTAGVSTPKEEMPPMSISVDCDVYPIIPFYLRLVGKEAEHRKMGKVMLEKRTDGNLYVDGVEVCRYFSPNQKDGRHIQGHELRKELRNKRVLNACVLDAIFRNQQMIPDDWKTGLTYFWGTIFCNPEDHLCVECLYWYFGRWRWRYRSLEECWYYNSPAAVLL